MSHITEGDEWHSAMRTRILIAPLYIVVITGCPESSVKIKVCFVYNHMIKLWIRKQINFSSVPVFNKLVERRNRTKS